MGRTLLSLVVLLCVAVVAAPSARAAYHHGGDTDSKVVAETYPEVSGSKLDSCALCHSGGAYEKKPGYFVELGSCQWCHYSYGYDQNGEIDETLNSYGRDYREMGRNSDALKMIAADDSDGDGYLNSEEIQALRYPGNAYDDPTKVTAPYKILSLDELERLAPHSQLMLMNTHKSGDFYAKYTGVPMANLLENVKMLDTATGITVFAPDGWAQYHPLEKDDDPLMYQVFGTYPPAQYYYHETAAYSVSNPDGWCSYDSRAIGGLQYGESIEVPGGLQMILAYQRDGQYLAPGELTASNKLDGEGPYRLVPPQKIPGPPDQRVTSDNQQVIWPFDDSADHNAGFSTGSTTMIRVEPLPPGTTDVDLLEAGWEYVDQKKILIYGALDPTENVLGIIAELRESVAAMEEGVFISPGVKNATQKRLTSSEHKIKSGHRLEAIEQLATLMARFNGCAGTNISEGDDWIQNCELQSSVYWSFYEAIVLLGAGK